MSFGIVKGVPLPENAPKKQSGQKYPLNDMEVGDSFFVPKSEMLDGDTPQKFRNRIYQTCKNFALRVREEGVAKREFTVLVMESDDQVPEAAESQDQQAPRWQAGDVGVWRLV